MFANANDKYPKINEIQKTSPFIITGSLNSAFDILLDSGINTIDTDPMKRSTTDNNKNIIIFLTKSPLVCEYK